MPYDVIKLANADVIVDAEERKPGADVKGNPGYTAEEWSYFEHGEKVDEKDKTILNDMAQVAARFDWSGKGYLPGLPKIASDFNHAAIALNVTYWVDLALAPNSGRENRELTLKHMIDYFATRVLAPDVTEKSEIRGITHIDTPTGRKELLGPPGTMRFVCIDHARLAAALFRELGYHVQDVNIAVGPKLPDDCAVAKKIGRTDFIWTYQSAALRVWFSGAGTTSIRIRTKRIESTSCTRSSKRQKPRARCCTSCPRGSAPAFRIFDMRSTFHSHRSRATSPRRTTARWRDGAPSRAAGTFETAESCGTPV